MRSHSDANFWADVDAIFSAAVDLLPEARPALLGARCDGRPELRAEVESLLAAHDQATGFLQPAGPRWPSSPLEPERPPDPSSDAVDSFGPGTLVGAYRLVERIGEGGMGSVFRAERADRAFAHDVAVKITRGSLTGADAARRFRARPAGTGPGPRAGVPRPCARSSTSGASPRNRTTSELRLDSWRSAWRAWPVGRAFRRAREGRRRVRAQPRHPPPARRRDPTNDYGRGRLAWVLAQLCARYNRLARRSEALAHGREAVQIAESRAGVDSQNRLELADYLATLAHTGTRRRPARECVPPRPPRVRHRPHARSEAGDGRRAPAHHEHDLRDDRPLRRVVAVESEPEQAGQLDREAATERPVRRRLRACSRPSL